MIRTTQVAFILLGMISFSGCITVSPTGMSWGASNKPKIQNVSFEEPEEEATDPKNPTQLKLTYAKLMEEVGQVVEARTHYSSVTSDEPDNLEAVLGLARLELVTGNYVEAEKGFLKALKLDPHSDSAQFGLGQFYASQTQWDKAVDPFTKAMLSDPNNSQYRYHLAVALTYSGDIDSALPHFIRTVGDAEAHYNVGLILKDQGQLDLAERHFLMAVTKKPSLTPAQDRLDQLRKQRQGVANRTPSGSKVPAHSLGANS